MEQFTASEVRTESCKQGQLHRQPASDMLNAFADLLEAQEKAVPVMVVNHVSSAEHDLPIGMKLYAHPSPSDAEKRDTMTPRELAKRIERGEKWKLADEPTPCQSRDAERLAEALRNLVSEWVAIADDGDATLEDSTIGYRACANRLSAMLAAHSTQAQPPAARVTDAMQELADKYHELLWAVARKFPGETRHETALRYIREAECQEAALAAQENPNG